MHFCISYCPYSFIYFSFCFVYCYLTTIFLVLLSAPDSAIALNDSLKSTFLSKRELVWSFKMFTRLKKLFFVESFVNFINKSLNYSNFALIYSFYFYNAVIFKSYSCCTAFLTLCSNPFEVCSANDNFY